MDVCIIQTIKDSFKYNILYESVFQMMNDVAELTVSNNNYDAECLISVGNLTTEIIVKKRTNKCVVIRFLFRSDISNNFYTDETLINYTFWVNDLDINILYPYLQTSSKIGIPFNLHTKELYIQKKENAESDIYVNIGETLYADSALFKILRTLNRLTHYDIDVCSRNKDFVNFMNANVHIEDSFCAIEEHVKKTKIVIGAGYPILYAIKYRKPFIIVGERGYGGIPNSNNIKHYFREFFQGAIGGRFDGPLPENLVYEDIQSIQNDEYDYSAEIGEILSSYIENMFHKVKKIIISIIKANQNANDVNLQFNSDYTIIEGNGHYWLLNRFTRLIIKKLDPSEMSFLKYYIEPTQDNENKPQLSEDKIIELIDNKVLLQKAICNLAICNY